LLVSDLKREKAFLIENPNLLQTVSVIESNPKQLTIAPKLIKELNNQ
jgi:hypothetical protein